MVGACLGVEVYLRVWTNLYAIDAFHTSIGNCATPFDWEYPQKTGGK